MAGNKLRVKIGTIVPKFQVTENFSKGEMVGIIEGEYPETFVFEFPKDKADILDTLVEGTYCTVHYNYRTNVVPDESAARDKVYLSLSAWKVEM